MRPRPGMPVSKILLYLVMIAALIMVRCGSTNSKMGAKIEGFLKPKPQSSTPKP